jgi:hypothetical protein
MGASKEPLFLVHVVQCLAFLGYVQVKDNIDIFVSHDWPTHIAHYGNKDSLLKCKPWFRDEVEQDTLGSPANWQLLQACKPRFWFAGHLHVAFPAMVPHGPRGALAPGCKDARQATKFMATDKPVPRRRYVQVCKTMPSSHSTGFKCVLSEYCSMLTRRSLCQGIVQHGIEANN